MRTHSIRRDRPDLIELHTNAGIPEPRSMCFPNSPARHGQHRNTVRSTQRPPGFRNGMAELLTDIDGVPVLMRFFVHDVPAEMGSESVSTEGDIRPPLSSTLHKMVDRMRGSPLLDDSSKPPVATLEVISSGDRLIPQPAPPKETVLRVGPLRLDLIDRAAKRGEREIDLRPREFRLLKYMMQRSDELLTRKILLKEVWRYKFVPETNLVDVHMGRLRRKVDGANDAPMIRTVRGAGFVLSTTPLLQCSTRGLSETLPK
jgi:DNA-binding winged helix-turn-helix (wHTH) protein